MNRQAVAHSKSFLEKPPNLQRKMFFGLVSSKLSFWVGVGVGFEGNENATSNRGLVVVSMLDILCAALRSGLYDHPRVARTSARISVDTTQQNGDYSRLLAVGAQRTGY